MKEVRHARDPSPGTRKILATGLIGVGKSTQFVTLPGKKFAYLFDPNAHAAILGHDIEFVEFVPDITDLDLSVKTLKRKKTSEGGEVVGDDPKRQRPPEPKTYVQWEEDFEERTRTKFFDSYDWLCFDGLTTFSEIIMDRVMYLNKRLGKHPEQPDYTAEMNTFRNVFRVATSLKCNLYCTAHTEIHRDETLAKTYAQLVMTGRNRLRIPMRFTEIYAMTTDEDSKGRTAFQCRTTPDRWNPVVRTSIKGLDPVEDVTIDWKKKAIGQGIGRFHTVNKPLTTK